MTSSLLAPYELLLLDMNGTFMFGGDRFSPNQDYAATYESLGGQLDAELVQSAINACFSHLETLYTNSDWHDRFPGVSSTLRSLPETCRLPEDELTRLERTFARHEVGQVPSSYADALKRLRVRHRLALVADIWASKDLWLDELMRADVLSVFDALIFSSDGTSVKPSPRLFEEALTITGIEPHDAVVIGDSTRRDLGGASSAGTPCILVGGAEHHRALASVPTILDLVR